MECGAKRIFAVHIGGEICNNGGTAYGLEQESNTVHNWSGEDDYNAWYNDNVGVLK